MKHTLPCLLLLLALFAIAGCRPAPLDEEPGATAAPAQPAPTATAEPTPPPLSTPTGEARGRAAAFCPELPRPALMLFVAAGDAGQTPAGDVQLLDPFGGASCVLPVGDLLPGRVALAGGSLFFIDPGASEPDVDVIVRVGPDGVRTPLSFTAVETAEGAFISGFAVSDDGERVAWGVSDPSRSQDGVVNRLWVADVGSGEIVAMAVAPVGAGVVPEEGTPPASAPEEDASARDVDVVQSALAPIRFSADGSALFFTRQPLGVGGSWVAFAGRYDNLYTLDLTERAPEPALVFDCTIRTLFMCLGDFYAEGAEVARLAYVNEEDRAVMITTGGGQDINALGTDADYIGAPTFNRSGELFYYTAVLADVDAGPPLPEMGTLLRVAPPTADPEPLASQPRLLPPLAFLDDEHAVVNLVEGDGVWGIGIVGVDGSVQRLELPAGATFVGVAR